MSSPDLITGHCLCGNVSYSIQSPELGAGVCHCDDCRRSTGAPYSVVVIVPRASVTIKGDYKEYLTNALSGKPAHRIFCPNCGSPVATYPESDKDIAYIKAGTLTDDFHKTLKPSIEIFTRYRLPYIQERFGGQFELGL